MIKNYINSTNESPKKKMINRISFLTLLILGFTELTSAKYNHFLTLIFYNIQALLSQQLQSFSL